MTDNTYETESHHTPESRGRDARLVGHEPKGETMTDDPKCEPGCISYYGGEKKHHRDCPYYPESLTKLNADRIEALLAERDALTAEVEKLREVESEIRALTPSAPAPVVPKVKPLVWRKSEKGVRFEETVCGSYVIYYRSGGGSTLSWGATCETVAEFSGDNLGRKARAAAQADHDARTLSQLDMAPVTVPEAAIIVADAIDADMTWANRMIEGYVNVTMEMPAKHWFSQILRALAQKEKK